MRQTRQLGRETPSDDPALREDEDALEPGDTLELLLAPAPEPEKGEDK